MVSIIFVAIKMYLVTWVLNAKDFVALNSASQAVHSLQQAPLSSLGTIFANRMEYVCAQKAAGAIWNQKVSYASKQSHIYSFEGVFWRVSPLMPLAKEMISSSA